MSGATKLRDLQAGTSEMMDSTAMETEEYYNQEGGEGEWSQKVDTGQLCRVCANPNEYLIPIFDGEGLEHELAMKIQKHLPIKITETDTLPLHICYQCASTLIAWHDLVISCVEADKKLRELQVEDEDDDDDKGAEMFESHSMDSDPADEVDQPSTSEVQTQITKAPPSKKATPNKEKKPKLKMVLVKGPPAGTSGQKTGAKTQLAKALEQAKSKEGGNEDSASERDHPEILLVERDSQSSIHVEEVACGDIKIDIKAESSSDTDICKQYPHNVVSTAEDDVYGSSENIDPQLINCIHCERPLLSSQLHLHLKALHPEFVHHCCDGNEYPLGTSDFKYFTNISNNVVIVERGKEISNSNLTSKAKTVNKSGPKIRQVQSKNQLHHCSICKREFSYVLDLANHAQKEHCPTVVLNDVQKKLQCQHCNLYFATESILEMHFTSVHKDKVESKTPALIELNDADELADNYIDDPLTLEEMTEVKAIRDSPTTHHVEMPQSSTKSGFKMSKEEIYNAQVIVDGKRFYQCKICNKHVYSQKTLIEHVRIHTGEKPYTCHVCGRQFRMLSQLTRHVNDVHERFRKYPCGICGRKFANRASLRDHTTIHTGVRSILCHLCGKSFKTKASLYMHSKFHVDGYPYPCPHCEKAFRTKEHLNNHILRHTGERPYECKHCGKRFFTSKTLNNHVLIHTNKQTYKCSECGKHFAQIRYLKNHERNHRKKAMKQISTGDILMSDSSNSN